MNFKPVILSGGSGTRLWPMSRATLPKQFISFPGLGSLFLNTAKRSMVVGQGVKPIVVSSRQHGFLCRKALNQIGLEAHYILEETGRNTAPAILFAALASDPDDILLIMPSDHWIEHIERFTSAVMSGLEACKDDRWVTFGIKPHEPAIGYGYIKTEKSSGGAFPVVSFTEKPNRETAEAYLSSGNCYWNAGIFMVRASTCLESFKRHQPELFTAAIRCWEAREQRPDEDILSKTALETISSVSVDYAIMEHEKNIILIPFDGGWSDVGSWDNLSTLIDKTSPDLADNVVLTKSHGTSVYTNGRTVAGVGLKDLIIVDDGDAVLVAQKGQTEHVKAIVDELKASGKKVAAEHNFEYRPWGMFENLLDSEVCKVKRLTVNPSHHLSLQYHHKRSEHWLVVQGTATVQLDDKKLTLEVGEAIDIPLGAHHALGNDTDEPVIVIEVQMGSYFGEDDIVRVSDPYGR